MGQDATFKNKFNVIKAEGWSIDEEVKFWIETTNLDKDIV